MEHIKSEILLTQELKKLVGWGASAQRLPFLPTIRSLAGVDEEGSLATIGYEILHYLADEIGALAGTYRFKDQEVEAEKLRRCYRLLLAMERDNYSAPRRRGVVIMLLGVYGNPDQWRRPISPEFDLLRILAKSMIRRHNERQQAA